MVEEDCIGSILWIFFELGIYEKYSNGRGTGLALGTMDGDQYTLK
ncbi:MAG: hypothetical protein AMXMBFR75_31090 [Candidatus Hinthialibacteria bacterium]